MEIGEENMALHRTQNHWQPNFGDPLNSHAPSEELLFTSSLVSKSHKIFAPKDIYLPNPLRNLPIWELDDNFLPLKGHSIKVPRCLVNGGSFVILIFFDALEMCEDYFVDFASPSTVLNITHKVDLYVYQFKMYCSSHCLQKQLLQLLITIVLF